MNVITILEENDAVEKFLSPFQKDFPEINFKYINSLSENSLAQFLSSIVQAPISIVEVKNNEVSFSNLLTILRKLNENSKIIVAANFSEFDDKKREKLKEVFKNEEAISGHLDFSNVYSELFYPYIRQILKNLELEKSQTGDLEILLELKRELDQVSLNVENELQKVKKLHEHIMPKRYSEIKGLNILSKYAVGENSGGEFFDIVYKNKKLAIVMSSSSSYVFSGMLLGHFSRLKKSQNLNLVDVKEFVKNVSKGIEGLGGEAENFSLIQLFVALIDLKTLHFEGFNFGKTLSLSSLGQQVAENQFPLHESFFEKAYFHFYVKRGEKVILLSPGLRKNTLDLVEGRPLAEYIQKLFAERPFDMLNELFFQLKKDKDNDFLQFDASSIIVEVNKNVLVQA